MPAPRRGLRRLDQRGLRRRASRSRPRGCIAQAWSVAEVLRCWVAHRRAGSGRVTDHEVRALERHPPAPDVPAGPRSASATSAPRPTASSTSSPPPARRSGRSCRSAPRATATRPTRRLSAFAGNPNLISPEELVAAGLLAEADLHDPPGFPADRVDYGKVIAYKRAPARQGLPALQSARAATPRAARDYERVLAPAAALARRLRAVRRAEGRARRRGLVDVGAARSRAASPRALDAARGATSPSRVEAHRFFQYVFFRAVARAQALRQRARRAHHRRHARSSSRTTPPTSGRDPICSSSTRDGSPTVVAGVPPDYFSADRPALGQPALRLGRGCGADGFAWWIERVRETLEARATSCGSITSAASRRAGRCRREDDTAEHGRWVPAPGARAAPGDHDGARRGDLPIIAEDLGIDHARRARAARRSSASPACACSSSPSAAIRTTRHLPHDYPRELRRLHRHARQRHGRSAGSRTRSRPDATPRPSAASCTTACATSAPTAPRSTGTSSAPSQMSVADVAIVPLQDVLGLGSEARMNTPARAEGNWAWRFRARRAHRRALRQRLRETTEHLRPIALRGLSGTPQQTGRLRHAAELRPLVLRRSGGCPPCVEAKPHCGLSASRSSGTSCAASAIRRRSSSTVSRRGFLVVTSPSTTLRSSGTRAAARSRPSARRRTRAGSAGSGSARTRGRSGS